MIHTADHLGVSKARAMRHVSAALSEGCQRMGTRSANCDKMQMAPCANPCCMPTEHAACLAEWVLGMWDWSNRARFALPFIVDTLPE